MRQNPHVRICGGPGSATTLVYPTPNGSHATGAIQRRGHDGQVKQGEQEGLHARDSVGQTSGAPQRCLKPGFSQRIGNSRRTRTGGSKRSASKAPAAMAPASQGRCATQGHRVVEVNRGDRRTRRTAGKSDTIDAAVAARSVLAGQSTATPKTADGAVEMMRQLKIARDTAVKARTAAMITLKQLVVHAPPQLREALQALTDRQLLTRCAARRPGPLDTPAASAKHTLRSIARRWFTLAEEITTHDRHLTRLTTETSPSLCESFGIGAHTAAELLILCGDNPTRIRSEAAFAKLCGACPIPASSGRTTGRHRLYRGGHRQANAALYRAAIARMRFHQPTVDYVARRSADGRTKREIIRCLKRFLARELYQRVMTDFRMRQRGTEAA